MRILQCKMVGGCLSVRFSVITSSGTQRLEPIYLHALWLCHAFSQWYIKTTLLSGLASFARVHYQVFWLTNLLMICQLINLSQPKIFWRQQIRNMEKQQRTLILYAINFKKVWHFELFYCQVWLLNNLRKLV